MHTYVNIPNSFLQIDGLNNYFNAEDLNVIGYVFTALLQNIACVVS